MAICKHKFSTHVRISTLPVYKFMLGDHRELKPPETILNSEVKRFIADGSVGIAHVRVGY